mgnify:CR=1 FL=1
MALALIAALILVPIDAGACFNPSDIGAVEILFNKPVVNHILTAQVGSPRKVLTVRTQ